MIAKNEQYENLDGGYRVSGGRLYLDDFQVPVDPTALRSALVEHFDRTGEDLQGQDRQISRRLAEEFFQMDRERTLPILAEQLAWTNQLRERDNVAAGFAARKAS